jgi:hypothetical protein
MKRNTLKKSRLILSLAVALAPAAASAFDSGSTGALGAFNPAASTVVTLPPDGILNYTTVNIPAGVTVTFEKNASNTPVVILASGDVTIAGELNLSATGSANVGSAGDGNVSDDGDPGHGGPGGYDGGHGGTPASRRGGNGLGPGGGGGGNMVYFYYYGTQPTGGGGAGYNGSGGHDGVGTAEGNTGLGGPAYGSPLLLPLIGGSGGGGGAGGANFNGSGGGGGGGALLVASSGTVTVSGKILANGGPSGAAAGYESGGTGGAGSGGAIRIVATTIQGEGTLQAVGSSPGGNSYSSGTSRNGGSGASGRVRLEAEYQKRSAASSPGYTSGKPGSVFLPGLPSLRITSVAGTTAPAEPTGTADITLPATTTNPVTVQFASTGVPAGSVVKLTVTPSIGAPVVVNSPGLVGTTDNATTSVSVTLPKGPSTLMATTSYTLTLAQGEALSTYAKGERVERVELAVSTGGTSMVTLVTVSGKKYTVPSKVAAMVAG